MIGLRYPIATQNGGLATTSDDERLTADAIASALKTQQGERVLRNYYGSGIGVFDLVRDRGDIDNRVALVLSESMQDYTAEITVDTQAPDVEGLVVVNITYTGNTTTVTL